MFDNDADPVRFIPLCGIPSRWINKDFQLGADLIKYKKAEWFLLLQVFLDCPDAVFMTLWYFYV